MTRSTVRLFLAIVAVGMLLVSPVTTSVSAQALESGTWTGTVEPPEGGTFDIEFVVEGGDDPAITLLFQDQSRPMDDIEFSEGVLHFSWFDGVLIACELLLADDGSFEGPCVGDDGAAGYLTMTPPLRRRASRPTGRRA